jgi:hypothetical protein
MASVSVTVSDGPAVGSELLPLSAAPVLESVVDTIADSDEDKEAASSGGKSVAQNSADRDSKSTKGRASAASGKNTPRDPFAFVGNLLTEGNGSASSTSHKKTASVPTGATLTYSPRISRSTRTQAKDNLGQTSQPILHPEDIEGQARRDNSPSTRSSSRKPKTEQPFASNKSLSTTDSEITNIQQSKRSPHCSPDPSARKKMDPTRSALAKNKHSAAKNGDRPPVEGEEAYPGSQENGNIAGADEVERYPSSSPVF